MDATEFLKTVFGENDGFLFIVTKDDRGELSNQKTFRYPEQLKSLTTYVSMREDEDLYFSPMLYNVPRRSRHTVKSMPVVYADTDSFNPIGYYIQPSINVVTGAPNGMPHRHSYWILDDTYNPDDVEAMAKAIAQAHAYKDDAGNQAGVDPGGWDKSQLLRLPGSVNTKATDTRIDPDKFAEFQARGYTENYPVYAEETSSGNIYSLADLAEAYDPSNRPQVVLKDGTEMPTELPDKLEVLRKITANPRLSQQLMREPRGREDWSDLMYALVSELLRSGFSPEEILVAAWDAPYNKYKRDKRPREHLWQYDIIAATNDKENKPRPKTERVAADDTPAPLPPKEVGEFSLEIEHVLVRKEERSLLTRTFVDDYVSWASAKTDAPVVFHKASAMAILSLIFGEWGVLDPQWGETRLGLFFVILGETTKERKTTSRNLMKSVIRLTQVAQFDYILTSNTTEESLNEKLAERPHQSSLYDRDEAQQLIVEVKGGKQYMKGFLESLNKLYDGWNEGRLRKGVHTTDTPVNFVQYLMGIRSQLQENLELSDFASGWGPRNLFVVGKSEAKTRENSKPKQGSGTGVDKEKMALVRQLVEARNFWSNESDSSREAPTIIKFEEDAWERITDIQWDLKEHFADHPRYEILSACFERFEINIMKVAALLAMSDKRNRANLTDVANACHIAIDWATNLILMVEGVAATATQRDLDALEQFIMDNDALVTWAKTLKWGTRNGKNRKDLWELVTVLKESGIIEVIEDGAGKMSLGLV